MTTCAHDTYVYIEGTKLMAMCNDPAATNCGWQLEVQYGGLMDDDWHQLCQDHRQHVEPRQPSPCTVTFKVGAPYQNSCVQCGHASMLHPGVYNPKFETCLGCRDGGEFK